jgi:hypothetical protein
VPVAAGAKLLFNSKAPRALVKVGTAEFPLSRARGFRLTLAALVFLANLAAIYAAFAPLDFRMPDYGLDHSWVAVLGEASAHGWRFGRDIIFTSGPLSSVYTHWFQLDHLGRDLAANIALIAVFSLLVTTVAWRNCRIATGFLFASVCLFIVRDGILVACPLLVSLVVLLPDQGISEKTSAALGVFCSALLTLAKFLIAPVAIVTFILCDIAAIARRRWPVYTLAYLLLCFGLFAWLEGRDSFLPYVFGSIDFASGYSEAMDLNGPGGELLTFLAAAAVLLGLSVWLKSEHYPRSACFQPRPCYAGSPWPHTCSSCSRKGLSGTTCMR